MSDKLPGRTNPDGSHRVCGWDVETHLIKDGCKAPKHVCTSFDDGENRLVLDGERALDRTEELLQPQAKTTLVAHYAQFDAGVSVTDRPRLMPMVFDAIDRGDFACTLMREKIVDIAKGHLKFEWDDVLQEYKRNPGYSLAVRVARRLDRHRAKGEDTYRLRYGELDGVPAEDYPKEAWDYSLQDSIDARLLYEDQAAECSPEGIPREREMVGAAWGLHLMSLWGVRTDAASVEALEFDLKKDFAKWTKVAKQDGYVRPSGSKNMNFIREAIEQSLARLGKRPIYTPKGKVSTARRQLLRCTDDEGLIAIAERGKVEKLLKTYLKVLKRGTVHPICPEYNLPLETFRSSCRAPNLQNPPRAGGVRECFVARPGYVFVFSDYDRIEMHTLAQVCLELFGYSQIAEAAHAGQDFHLALAAVRLNISYDEAKRRYKAGDGEVAEWRQMLKIANYGFGGGMGAKTFVKFCQQANMEIDLDQSKELRQTYLDAWSEMQDYFAHASEMCQPHGRAEHLVFPRSQLVRGDVKYTAVCNGYFQHRAAMGALAAVYGVARECYTVRSSPLYGCRPWLFAHDEIGMEVPEGSPREMHDSASRLAEVMQREMRKWCPDVPIGASAAMCRRWYKGAEAVYNDDGMMIPCHPIKDHDGRTRWVAD